MRVLCVGGGPAGLYLALLLKKRDPGRELVVVERNRPYDTFGWGVVFSDQTLGNLAGADPETHAEISEAFSHWDDIDVHFKGRTITSGGHGFCGIGRKRLLNILQRRCEALGVRLVFETEVTDEAAFGPQDLVVASDGINSALRSKYAHVFEPFIERRRCRYIWLGTRRRFDAFTFAFEKTPWGWFQAHAYRFDAETSTFIVETPESVWKAAGLDRMSTDESVAFCERLFAPYLAGERLMTNARHLRGSAWINFLRVANATWLNLNGPAPMVLLGDAAHTAHFSVGSGTKLALEDAIALAAAIERHRDLRDALRAYEAERTIEVLRIQNAARNSTEWFENVDRYVDFEPEQFAYSLLTRSQRISHENLRLRDAAFVQRTERWFAGRSGLDAAAMPPMFTPFSLRGITVPNRIVVSPMAQYSCVDGTPDDYYLVHLGSRAHGGAGLVFTEMTCVSADARISPGCAGMYAPAHVAAWTRIVDYVHARTPARIALQLGHAGPKGSTQVGWEDADEPLPASSPTPNWPLRRAFGGSLRARATPYPVPWTAPTWTACATISCAPPRGAPRAASTGSNSIAPTATSSPPFFRRSPTGARTSTAGALGTAAAIPLEVFAAMRAAWPAEKPLSVRISAHDWAPGGNTAEDAVEIARLFKSAGADLIDVSSGQTTRDAQPVYGRMYQTPFADRIRNEVGIATMAVGAIFEADHVNSIIMAGRADLCALARPHLADPYWTLHAAAALGYDAMPWPKQYLAGKAQLERNLARAAELARDVPEANG